MNCKEFTPKQAIALAAIIIIPLAAAVNFPLPAKGADYERDFPPPAPTYDMVEFASGWYVRGDIAYAQETFPKVAPAFAVDPLQPPILLPATLLNPSRSLLNSFSAGAGTGYKVNNWFRTDLILDYRPEVQAGFVGPPVSMPYCITSISPAPGTNFPVPSGWDQCTPRLNTEIHRWDLLANGYIDLATWQGFTPYIGAGMGVTWARIKQSVNWFMSNGLPYQVNTGGFYFNYDRSQGTMTYNFAWALMAGLSIAVADHVQLDAGYRFLNLGTVSGISAATGAQTTQRVIANEVRAGLRYMID